MSRPVTGNTSSMFPATVTVSVSSSSSSSSPPKVMSSPPQAAIEHASRKARAGRVQGESRSGFMQASLWDRASRQVRRCGFSRHFLDCSGRRGGKARLGDDVAGALLHFFVDAADVLAEDTEAEQLCAAEDEHE